jgi:hypothetical protein
MADRAVGLDFPGALVKPGLCADTPGGSDIGLFLWHWHLLAGDIISLQFSISIGFHPKQPV